MEANPFKLPAVDEPALAESVKRKWLGRLQSRGIRLVLTPTLDRPRRKEPVKTSGHTILLVDDDPNDVLLMQRAFRKANLTNPLQVTRDGQEAIEYLSRQGIRRRRSAGCLAPKPNPHRALWMTI